jgi:hypothetical protein
MATYTTSGSKGRLPARLPIRFIVYVAVLILLASGFAWLYHVQNSPDKVFWGMIRNNLNTTGFSRTIVQDEGEQRLEQVIDVRTQPYHLANSRSTITQGQPATTKVVTESIGTPLRDYVRYAQIQTSQKSSSGKDLDFSNVTNVWGMAETQGTATNGQLYNESVLGVIPFGNLPAARQNALIKQMKDSGAYKYDVASIERTGIFRRPRYVFNVQIDPAAYIATLKAFAKDIGLTHLETLDPAQYESAQPVMIQLTTDGWSRELTEVSYGGGSRIEKFGSFNSLKSLQQPPMEAIPISELQARLQTIQ